MGQGLGDSNRARVRRRRADGLINTKSDEIFGELRSPKLLVTKVTDIDYLYCFCVVTPLAPLTLRGGML